MGTMALARPQGRIDGLRAATRRTKPRPRNNLTLERIIAEGARVFNRRGYYGTTLDDMARALGVTKAALYYYVRSKEDVLFRCHEASLDIGMEGIHRALLESSAPDEQLRIALREYIMAMTDQLRGTLALLEEGALSGRHLRQIIRRRDTYERTLRKIIERGVAARVFVPCDPKLIGFAILGAMNWIPKWFSPDGKRSGREIADVFASYLVRGLQRTPAVAAIRPGSS